LSITNSYPNLPSTDSRQVKEMQEVDAEFEVLYKAYVKKAGSEISNPLGI
jgi:hypothetical protein